MSRGLRGGRDKAVVCLRVLLLASTFHQASQVEQYQSLSDHTRIKIIKRSQPCAVRASARAVGEKSL